VDTCNYFKVMAERQSILLYILTVTLDCDDIFKASTRSSTGPIYLHEMSMVVTVRSVKEEIGEEACWMVDIE